jgi:hypothetical protein
VKDSAAIEVTPARCNICGKRLEEGEHVVVTLDEDDNAVGVTHQACQN